MVAVNGTYSQTQNVIGVVGGYSSSAVTLNQYLYEGYLPFSCSLGGIKVGAQVAGTGAGTTVVDVFINGRSIWDKTSGKPTLSALSVGIFPSARTDAHSINVRKGDFITVQVTQISNTGHARLSASVALETINQFRPGGATNNG